MRNSIKSAFDNNGYKYQVFNDGDRTIFKLGMGLENGKADCLLIVKWRNASNLYL